MALGDTINLYMDLHFQKCLFYASSVCRGNSQSSKSFQTLVYESNVHFKDLVSSLVILTD